jgi:hypothetical protein
MKYFLLLAFSGCIKHNYVGKDFKSSNSLCLDALTINMAADGCKHILTKANEKEHILKIFCNDDKKRGDSPWLHYIFYVMPTITDKDNISNETICVDPRLTLSYGTR